MNQEKIGKFIAKNRKDKNLTQEALAEKLGISINAVSKWERGISFPDVSLFKKLCSELNISIEELINGEKSKSTESKDKAIIASLEEKDKVEKKSKKKIIILSIFILLIITFSVIYSNTLKINLINESNDLYDRAIDYLRNKEFKSNPDSSKDDFNVFYSYHSFGIEKKGNYKYMYMWIYSESDYLEEKDSLAISTGSSTPVKITLKDNKVINAEYPKDGNEYASSIYKLFPRTIAKQVLNFDNEKNINKLYNEMSTKKNKYYNYLNMDMGKLTIDDISYGDHIFNITKRKKCVTVSLDIYKNNKYRLSTAYKACKPNQTCTMELRYTKSVEGTYDYNIMEIIKHSSDANLLQFTNDNMPVYEIHSGKGQHFITDDDNKHLKEFLKSINVDLSLCAEPDYK